MPFQTQLAIGRKHSVNRGLHCAVCACSTGPMHSRPCTTGTAMRNETPAAVRPLGVCSAARTSRGGWCCAVLCWPRHCHDAHGNLNMTLYVYCYMAACCMHHAVTPSLIVLSVIVLLQTQLQHRQHPARYDTYGMHDTNT